MARSMNTYGPTLATPPWTNDFLSRDHLIPGGAKLNAALFLATDAVVVTLTANAAAGATSLTVTALTGAIPSGTLLDFGTTKFARTTADAAAGATSITVAATPTAMVTNDTATYAGVGQRTVPSGTIVGRTIAERDASTGYGPAVDTDDEIYLTAFEITDVNEYGDVELVRHNAVIKENFLPGWASASSALKDEVRARYRCMRGAD